MVRHSFSGRNIGNKVVKDKPHRLSSPAIKPDGSLKGKVLRSGISKNRFLKQPLSDSLKKEHRGLLFPDLSAPVTIHSGAF